MPRFFTLCLVALTPALVGCMGSPNPYRPGYQPRPPEVTVESQIDRTIRRSIPADLKRADWRRVLEEREIARLYNRSTQRNAWFAYEADMLETLGPEEAARYLGGRKASQEAAPIDPDDVDEDIDDYDDDDGDDGGDEYGDDEYGDDY